jgi:cephalosporin hydroxylase
MNPREVLRTIGTPVLHGLRKRLRTMLRLARGRSLDDLYFEEIVRWTDNFGHLEWMGCPIWQNVFDLWTIQEAIHEQRPELLIECGTNRGGSALFYAHLFDLLNHGSVITIDIKPLHSLSHPLIHALLGSSVEAEVIAAVSQRVQDANGPVMVIFDSDHAATHVRQEMEAYQHFVTPDGLMLVQDGVIDRLDIFREARPGPLPAIEAFLADHPEFSVDQRLCSKFPLSHHPLGWLRKNTSRQKSRAAADAMGATAVS